MEPTIGLHIQRNPKYNNDVSESINVIHNIDRVGKVIDPKENSKEIPKEEPTGIPTGIPKEDPKDARPLLPKPQSLKLKQQKSKFKPPSRYIGKTTIRPPIEFSLVPPALPPPPNPSLDVRDLPTTSLQKRKKKTASNISFRPNRNPTPVMIESQKKLRDSEHMRRANIPPSISNATVKKIPLLPPRQPKYQILSITPEEMELLKKTHHL
jgi:hypothetical protein